MQIRLLSLVIFSVLLMSPLSRAASPATMRIQQLSNDKVSVWETVIYPGSPQALTMHRHDHDRVLVAFTDGLLKVTNEKGRVHYLKLEKNKAYYLTKDAPHELHTDQNMSSHPVKVMVIELKN